MSDEVDVVIVGAGLAGLCAARATTGAGLATVVLEADDGVGGRVRTDAVDGFLLDRGFQILLTGYPDVQGALDLDGLDLCRFDPASLVWTGSRMERVADPLRRPSALLDTMRADVGSLADKARIGLLRQRLVRTPAVRLLQAADRSAAEALAEAGFSEKMVRRFFRPLLGGIQLDPDLASSSRMYEIIFRTLALGDAAVPGRGMQAIPDQLHAALQPSTVRLSSPVERIDGTAAVLGDGSRVQGRAFGGHHESPALDAAPVTEHGGGPVDRDPRPRVEVGVGTVVRMRRGTRPRPGDRARRHRRWTGAEPRRDVRGGSLVRASWAVARRGRVPW